MVELRDYQQRALEHLEGLYASGHPRATLVLPCGTGKTIVAAHLVATLHHKRRSLTVMLVPTVDLLSQTIDRIATSISAATFLAVCSNQALSVDDMPIPTTEVAEAHALGEPVTTDPEAVADVLRSSRHLVVVATYASVGVVIEAVTNTARTVDLLICDEAHRTAGFTSKAWGKPLDNTLLPAHRRLFMTATTRIVTAPESLPEDADPTDWQVVSMDSVADYGPHVAPLSFRDAINQGYLSDYRIAVVAVTDTDVYRQMGRAHSGGGHFDARTAAAQVAILNYAQRHQYLRSILAFHSSIAASKQWSRELRQVADHGAYDLDAANVVHVDGESAPAQRTRARNVLADSDALGVVSNCKLFAEGVDVPALDAVLFAGPRTSSPDIVQIVGRAMRPHPGGKDRKALIILPVIDNVDDASPIDVKVARSTHLAAWQVLTTLAEDDEVANYALVQWRSYTENPEETLPVNTVAIDTSLIPDTAADSFRLRLVRRTTSHYILTAHKLTEFFSRTGHANPPAAYVTADGYPLGQRIRHTRVADSEGRLPPRIRAMFDAVPGWRWTAASRTLRRTPDEWIDLIETHVQQTGIRTVHAWEKTKDDHGQHAKIGDWLHNLHRHKLTTEQRTRLAQVVNVP